MEKSTAGSLKFMAPELFVGKTHSTPKLDIWSIGCLLYAMIMGEYPFSDSDREQLKKIILKKEICLSKSLKAKSLASSDCLDLVDRMLMKEPADRISLIDVLHHPWMLQLDQYDDAI